MASVLSVATKSPGVYVFEEPSAVKAIGGVSTSTAGFIGVFPGPATGPGIAKKEPITVRDKTDTFPLEGYPIEPKTGVSVPVTRTLATPADFTVADNKVTLASAPPGDAKYTVSYKISGTKTKDPNLTASLTGELSLTGTPDPNSVTVMVETTETASLSNDDNNQKSQVKFTKALDIGSKFEVEYTIKPKSQEVLLPKAPEGVPLLFTNFTEFKNQFGDFDGTATLANYLRHAVFGFFNNGGSRCYVIWVSGSPKTIDSALSELAAIDEIALVVAPGNTSAYADLSDHCKDGTLYRFAILDGPGPAKGNITSPETLNMPSKTNYAAFYYPWIKAFDPKVEDPNNPDKKGGLLDVPPSGHLAGIYARVDSQRGVHKAPANETIYGARGVTHPLSKPQQDGLNAKGVNCIRVLNNNILVWGARTVGGEDNQDLKYINVRRTLLFLRKSIDQNTQWVVFEPNTLALWKKIVRNVDAFLTIVWRSGALFGETPQAAFYVRCDDEINPPSQRELGLVVTEIGVAIARPAEFVVFRISQITAPA